MEALSLLVRTGIPLDHEICNFNLEKYFVIVVDNQMTLVLN